MRLDFKWYWLEPEENASADFVANSFRGKINYQHFKNPTKLLKSLSGEKGNFGIIQEITLKQERVTSPKEWNGEKDTSYKFDPFGRGRYLDGFVFYNKIIMEEGFKKGILPPPVIFLSNIGEAPPIYDPCVNEIKQIRMKWAEMHGLEDLENSKVKYFQKNGASYKDLTDTLLEFQE